MNSISTELWWKHAVFYCLDVEMLVGRVVER